MKHPIDSIQWLHVSQLDANDYNPNVVFTMELRLLERSILKTGWLQPILVAPVGDRFRIIDGFHRFSLARDSKAIQERDAGMVPVAVLDLSPEEVRLLTVRINRAKGSHVALRMQALVRELVDDMGLDPQQVALEIGASIDEVKHLYGANIYLDKGLKDAPYSRAWEPRDSKVHGEHWVEGKGSAKAKARHGRR